MLFSGNGRVFSLLWLSMSILLFLRLSFVTGVGYSLKHNIWDNGYEDGTWRYLATNPMERARLGTIYGAYYLVYAKHGHLLDVGCGEGALAEFFPPHSPFYHGVDVSSVALATARVLRPNFEFIHANAEDFVPPATGPQLYKMIVFSEMIYYCDHNALVKKYLNLLEPNGTMVLGLWGANREAVEKHQVYLDFQKHLSKRFDIALSGISTNDKTKEVFPVTFLVIAFSRKGEESFW
jgi:SAM-dependent methyltransferase